MAELVPELTRIAAFSDSGAGGNPAGVWIGDTLPAAEEMQRIAAEVGFSETAFAAPIPDRDIYHWRVRYFSPAAEVPFCGHATIAAGDWKAVSDKCRESLEYVAKAREKK